MFVSNVHPYKAMTKAHTPLLLLSFLFLFASCGPSDDSGGGSDSSEVGSQSGSVDIYDPDRTNPADLRGLNKITNDGFGVSENIHHVQRINDGLIESVVVPNNRHVTNTLFEHTVAYEHHFL